jgi:serine protease Do
MLRAEKITHRVSYRIGRLVVAWFAIAGAGSIHAASCGQALSAIFDEVAPAVVRVFSVAIDPFSVRERVQMAVGTGVAIDDGGHIVTNAHLVFETSEIMVSLAEDDLLPAVVVGVDPITDLAILELEIPIIEIPAATLGTSADLTVGEEVLAIGFPFGIGKTASRGIVSALERVVPVSPFSWRTPFIQTDAAINPGNSGGPLIDSCGRVIGINTLSTELGQNLSFAVPIDVVREVAAELIADGHVSRAWHGINGRMIPLPLAMTLGLPPGFLVETIEPGSPAEEIGLNGGSFPVVLGGEEFLLGGDILLSVNGEPLTDVETVNRIARSLEVNDTVALEYSHNDRLMRAEVILPERPILPGDVRRFRERRSLR